MGNSGTACGVDGDGTNLVGVPAGFIGSTDFNALNQPLHIAGVREMNGGAVPHAWTRPPTRSDAGAGVQPPT